MYQAQKSWVKYQTGPKNGFPELQAEMFALVHEKQHACVCEAEARTTSPKHGNQRTNS